MGVLFGLAWTCGCLYKAIYGKFEWMLIPFLAVGLVIAFIPGVASMMRVFNEKILIKNGIVKYWDRRGDLVAEAGLDEIRAMRSTMWPPYLNGCFHYETPNGRITVSNKMSNVLTIKEILNTGLSKR